MFDFYVKVYILVPFIFVSMSHILIFIYCNDFYIDLVGYIELQFWLDLIIIFYVYKSKFNIDK